MDVLYNYEQTSIPDDETETDLSYAFIPTSKKRRLFPIILCRN